MKINTNPSFNRWGFFFYMIFIKQTLPMKKVIRLAESDLMRIVKRVIEEQYDEPLKEKLTNIGGETEPIKLFSDKNETDLIGITFFDEVFKNPDGSLNLYPGEIKFTSMLGTKSGYKLLVFKCGTKGLLSKGNGKIVYSKKLEYFLSKEYCKK